ncbi:chaperone protein DNAj, putative [Trypanosoma equiperdum]|uniref:Chaperone protein DNAj, putative n=1 Tax=Trypanosoma equiperdum TaxID=5694 RepID=A0A1G4IFF8_TRYEQ|nr:chaperone protein DNAj, putative [Trypanosoma equiperdum]
MFVDYYAVLNLHPSCTAKEIREAFKRFALLCHPDRTDADQSRNFSEVKDAYDVLSDPARRYLYDLGYADAISAIQRQTLMQKKGRDVEAVAPVVRSPQPFFSSTTSSLNSASSPSAYSQPTMPPCSHPCDRRDSPMGSLGPSLAQDYQQGSAFRAVRGHHHAVRRNQVSWTHGSEERSYDSRAASLFANMPADKEEECQSKPSPPRPRVGKRIPPKAPSGCVKRSRAGSSRCPLPHCTVGPNIVLGTKVTAVSLEGEGHCLQRHLKMPTNEAINASIIKTWGVFFNI